MLHRLAALGGIWVVRQTSRTRATNIWAHRRGTYREGASAQQLIAAGYGQVLAERMVALGGSAACAGVAQPNWQLDAAKYVPLPLFSRFISFRHSILVPVNAYAFVESKPTIPPPPKFLVRATPASSPPSISRNRKPKLQPQRLAIFHGKIYPRQIRLIGGFPEAVASTSHILQNGDVVVFVTSGVLDNLSSKEILSVSYEMVTARVEFRLRSYHLWLLGMAMVAGGRGQDCRGNCGKPWRDW